MRKWFIVALVACVAVAFNADAKKGKSKGGSSSDSTMTKQAYISQQKALLGSSFDQAKAEEKFAKLDKNGDGVLSAAELGGGSDTGKKGKKKK